MTVEVSDFTIINTQCVLLVNNFCAQNKYKYVYIKAIVFQ